MRNAFSNSKLQPKQNVYQQHSQPGAPQGAPQGTPGSSIVPGAQVSYGTTQQQAQVVELLLGRYRVLESRATGGFGRVDVCWDTRLQRRVAIKCMPLLPIQAAPSNSTYPDDGSNLPGVEPSFGPDRSSVAEALGEARTASLLSHPNIVGVYDFDFDGSCAYLVMEYVDGLSLAELLSRVEGGTLTAQELSHIVDRVADALTFAHENGVLHLDIKPSNILIDHNGNPRLCDFGMATLASAAGYGDARGGTVGYMPPEQIEGSFVDERTDLFALATCCTQALIGTNPFAAPTADESLELELDGAIDALASIQMELGPRVGEALASALAPDLTVRCSSVQQFADELVPALGDADAGLASLRGLLEQSTNDEQTPPQVQGRPLTLTERAPWFPQILRRVCVAAASAWCCAQVLPYLLGSPATLTLEQTLLSATLTLLAAGLAAALPPLGTGLASVALIGRLFIVAATPEAADAANATHVTQATGSHTPLAALALAGVISTLVAFWWWRSARREELALPALSLPLALGSLAGPAVSAPLLAWGASPLNAALGSVCTTLLYSLFVGATASTAGVASGIQGGATAYYNLLSSMGHPAFWLYVAGCAAAAALGSKICRSGKPEHVANTRTQVARGIVAQVIVFLGTQFIVIFTSRMEIAGIWGQEIEPHVGFALLLSVLMCAAAAILGCSHTRQEE